MTYHADPGIFGHAAATRGFGGRSNHTAAPLTPPDDPDPHEGSAPYCDGPGHLYEPDPDEYDRTPGDILRKIEDCPACKGKGVRNHHEYRTVAGEMEAAS